MYLKKYFVSGNLSPIYRDRNVKKANEIITASEYFKFKPTKPSIRI